MLPRMSAYVKRYDSEIKCLYFWTEDDELLEKYNDIWKEVSNGIKKNLIGNTSTIKNFWKPK